MTGAMELVAQLSQGDSLKSLSRQPGMDEDALGKGIATAAPLLVTALAHNASPRDRAADRCQDHRRGPRSGRPDARHARTAGDGAVGRLQRSERLDASTLPQRLAGMRDGLQQHAPEQLAAARQLLDRNRDGSILDDVGGFVGKLFQKG